MNDGGSPARVSTAHAAVPGRTRLRVAGLRGSAGLAALVESEFSRRQGSWTISASALSGTVLVLHARSVAPEEVRQALETFLGAARP